MRVPSDEALELMDFMVEVGAVGVSGAATSVQLRDALDIRKDEDIDELLRELIGSGFVIRKLPASISGRTTYHVDSQTYQRLLKSLDDDVLAAESPPATDWASVRADVQKLTDIVADADLSQEKKAQAGALVESVRVLAEAPEPPAKLIRSLLYDLAALATLFALALQIADKVK